MTTALPGMERTSQCRVCHSSSVVAWRSDCPDVAGVSPQTFAYSRCRSCRARFLSYGPEAAGAGAFYPQDYAPYTRPQGDARAVLGILDEDHELDEASEHLQKGLRATYLRGSGRLLDFGFGSTANLDALRDLGWSVTGADFSPGSVAAAHDAGHDGRQVDDAFWKDLEREQFDVIRMNHVVEHLYEPHQRLQSLWLSVARGGVLHMATPNPAGVSASLFRNSWFSLEAPRHVTLFPPATLAALMTGLGARPVDVAVEPVAKDFFRSIDLATAQAPAMLRRLATNRVLTRVSSRALAEAGRRGIADRYHVFAHRT